jgi:hypothetical protein
VTPLTNHFHDFLAHPWGGLALLPLLLHQPPLFDILPMYVILLGATPLLLAVARRYGWTLVVLLSAIVWLVAQFKWDALLGDPSRLPAVRLASFNLFAWQFLWTCGIALGETATRRPLVTALTVPPSPCPSCCSDCSSSPLHQANRNTNGKVLPW